MDILGRSVVKNNKQVVAEALYLDLEDLKQSKADGGGGGGGEWRQKTVVPSS